MLKTALISAIKLINTVNCGFVVKTPPAAKNVHSVLVEKHFGNVKVPTLILRGLITETATANGSASFKIW